MNNKTDMQDVLDRLEGTKVLQTIRADQARDLKTKREGAAQEIKKLNKAFLPENAKLRKLREKTEQRSIETAATAKQAEFDFHQARLNVSNNSLSHDSDIRTQEKILLSSYDSKIDETIETFNKLWEHYRKDNVLSKYGYTSRNNPATMKTESSVLTNNESITAAMKYIRESINKLNTWKLKVSVSQEDLSKLLDGIPPEDWIEYSGEKPFGKLPSWKSGVPSDSQHDLRMDKLLKAKT